MFPGDKCQYSQEHDGEASGWGNVRERFGRNHVDASYSHTEGGEFPCCPLRSNGHSFGVAKTEVAPQNIMDFIDGHVPPYKKVREVELEKQIPKSPSGKIFRRLLVAKERAVLTSLLWEEFRRAVLPR